MIEIIPYDSNSREAWDETVKSSRNGTFLHLRDYMDYHADRFEDCSLIARDEKRKIMALLPANRKGDTAVSHGGLTYGGWIMTPGTTIVRMMDIWDRMTSHYKDAGIYEMYYKPVPHIFHRYPAEEDLYPLWRNGGQLDTCQVSTAIDLTCPYPFDENARRNIRKAEKDNIHVGPSDRWEEFWAILTECLTTRHNVLPVHTLDEMLTLKKRFPDNIELYGATQGDRMLGGLVMYRTGTVMHNQYNGTTPEGRASGAIPMLYRYILENCCCGLRYLDFGTSNENHGLYLNEGLVRQKCGFGGRTVVFNTYKISF